MCTAVIQNEYTTFDNILEKERERQDDTFHSMENTSITDYSGLSSCPQS